ncbi:MAG: hypothetical protein IJP26_04365 [Clostridia bacterium]|nr:hypothetical protein [Clostridia bacterium]
MNYKFKKITILSLCFFVCFVFLKALQAVFCLDSVTGFLKSGYAFYGNEITIFIFLFLAFLYFFCFSCPFIPKEYPKNNCFLAVGYYSLALSCFVDVVFFEKSKFSAPWQNALFLILGVACFLYFILCGTSGFVKIPFVANENGVINPLFSLIPILFYLIKIIVFFTFYTEIPVVTDVIFEIGVLILFLIFFLFLAKLKNNINVVSTQKKIIPVTIIAFLLGATQSLPQIILFLLFKNRFVKTPGTHLISNVFVLIFLVIFYVFLTLPNNTKNKPKKHS